MVCLKVDAHWILKNRWSRTIEATVIINHLKKLLSEHTGMKPREGCISDKHGNKEQEWSVDLLVSWRDFIHIYFNERYNVLVKWISFVFGKLGQNSWKIGCTKFSVCHNIWMINYELRCKLVFCVACVRSGFCSLAFFNYAVQVLCHGPQCCDSNRLALLPSGSSFGWVKRVLKHAWRWGHWQGIACCRATGSGRSVGLLMPNGV